MARLNWEIIYANITEAREELQNIEARINTDEQLSEIEFQIAIEHAYGHLNTAWNARRQPIERYANLSEEDFHAWRRFPTELALSQEP
jgi:hypothetical protein